jgi:hypothetical protein
MSSMEGIDVEEGDPVMLPALERRRDKKYVQGPKLKILPSQLERPEEPSFLLGLYESFSQMQPRGEHESLEQDRILEEATPAERRALFPVMPPANGQRNTPKEEEMDWLIEQTSGFSLDQEEFDEQSHEELKKPGDSWKTAYDPWNAHSAAGYNKKKPSWGSRQLKQQTLPAPKQRRRGAKDIQGDSSQDKHHVSKQKRSKTALGVAGEASRGEGEVDLHKVLELAETMLIGNTACNRLESSLWGGSEDLTMPYVRINQDDVLEIVTHKKGGELKRMKWNEHAEARVCGVLAMKGLMARHQAMKQSRDDLEAQLVAMKKEVRSSWCRVCSIPHTSCTYEFICVCVCVCARARARARAYLCVSAILASISECFSTCI